MPSFQNRRLFKTKNQREDPQGSMLSIISLLLLLLPFLLLTTSPQKLAALGFRLPENGDDLPPLPKGIVEDLWVETHATTVTLHKKIRTTDIGASEGQSTLSKMEIASRDASFDLGTLQEALREIKLLDPNRVRVRLQPHPEATASEVVTLMDALRSDASGTLFEEVVLAGAP